MLIRKNQLLRKVETTEGTAATLTASDYVQALDPQITTPQDIEDRAVSGASLSEDVGVAGRSSFTARYGLDLVSLGGSIVPLSDPDMRACGLQSGSTQMTYLTVTVAPTGPTWAGQVLDDGVGGTATLAVPVGSSGRMYYRGAAGGFPGGTTISTPTSSTMTVSSTTPTLSGFAYRPDSTQTAVVTLTSGTWGGSAVPPVVGEIVSNGLTGASAARGIVVSLISTALEITPILPSRAFLTGETVTGLTGAGTNTVAAAGQVLYRVPSITIQSNIDSWYRRGVGCRGNATMVLEAGKVGRLDFEMSGGLGAHGDAALLTGTTTIPQSQLPRWHSATANIDGFEIPVARWTLNMGNTVALLEDAHAVSGIRGSSVTARQPSLAVDFDQVPAAVLNYLTRMQNSTTSSFFTMWGSTVGFRVGCHVPKGQIYSREDADRDGVLAADLNVRCKRETSDGDNEFYWLFGI